MLLGKLSANKLPLGFRELRLIPELIRIRLGGLRADCDSHFFFAQKQENVYPVPQSVLWQIAGVLFEFLQRQPWPIRPLRKSESPYTVSATPTLGSAPLVETLQHFVKPAQVVEFDSIVIRRAWAP